MRVRKVDANQPAMVRELRAAGYSVAHIHTVGKGCPDLLVGKRNRTMVVEVKNGPKDKLTDDEIEWRDRWTGSYVVAWQAEQVMQAFEHGER